MPHDRSNPVTLETADAFFRQAVMNTFCTIMRSSGLSPMEVINIAASAVGALYRDACERHEGDDACCCGWQPCRQKDIETLQLALAAATDPCPFRNLLLGDPAGRA